MLQGTSSVQQKVKVPGLDIEEIDRIIALGKINPAQPEVAGANVPKENKVCQKREGVNPVVTDWTKFDQGQIWEIYQGLVKGVNVSAFFNPQLSANEMCAMRLAAE